MPRTCKRELNADVAFVTLTPNLALDRTLKLQTPLTPGELHRVKGLREAAGGKGVNVARVLQILGAKVTVAGFLGGFNGQKFRALLAQEGLPGVFEEVSGETRECHILLDGSTHPTEVYEAGPTVTADDWRRLAAQLPEELPEGQMIVSGSLPRGLSPEAFRALLQELPRKPVVDSSGAALWAALEAGVALVKPNRHELAELLPVQGDGVAEAKRLFERYGVPILLSLGAQGAAYIAEQTLRVPAPEVEVTNPVASGDCLLAAFVWARSEEWSLEGALRLGVSAGAEDAAQGGGAAVTRAGIMARFAAQPPA